MDRHTSVRVRLDRSTGSDDAAATLSWPPRDDSGHTEVVDLTAEEGAFGTEAAPVPSERSATRAEYPAPVSGGARHPPAASHLPTRAPRRTSRLVRGAIAALAALAIVEGVVIVLQFTRGDDVRQMTVAAAERLGLRTAGAAASSATKPGTSASQPAAAASVPARAAAEQAIDAGGQLQVQTDRTGATVIVDGQRRGTAPLTVQGLAPGPHQVRLVAGGRSVEQTVIVQPAVATALVVPMGHAAAAAGWVDLVMPFEVQIVEQGRLVGTSAQSRLQFPAGEHRFELVNDALGYRAMHVARVKPGEVAEVRPDVPTGLLSINAMPWAEVWIDGRQAGTTPLGNVRVPLGMREIRFRHPELGDETRRVLVTTREPARVSLDFRQ